MKELKAYYRQIRGWLPCGGRLRKQMMQEIKATVEGYRAERPEADFSALQAHFGTPQQIAAAFVDEMGTEELLRALRVRRRIMKIVFLFLLLILIIYLGLLVITWLISIFNAFGDGVMGPPVILE